MIINNQRFVKKFWLLKETVETGTSLHGLRRMKGLYRPKVV
jgi:hypothetical protein